jgi:hypothetical protein
MDYNLTLNNLFYKNNWSFNFYNFVDVIKVKVRLNCNQQC